MAFLKQFDLTCFDFDGLLVNTEKLHYKAYSNMLKNRGYELTATFNDFINIAHRSSTGLCNMIYTKYPDLMEKQPEWSILYEEKTHAYLKQLEQENLELLPGVDKLLKHIEEYEIKHCVVTHSTRQQIELIKSRLPLLNAIKNWVTREDYEKPKPAPDGYLKALEQYANPGDRVIGFEDALRGITALQRAEIIPVLICPKDHPQIPDVPKEILYSTSFLQFLNW